jgi:hypothetical protein
MRTAGWMRAQRDRPIAEHERRAAMAVVVALLAAAALLLTLTQPVSQARRVTPSVELAHEGARTVSDPGVLIPEARQSAERFLAGYLGYAYGHSPASWIADASRSLIQSVEAQPPRVPPAARARHPRVISLQLRVAPAGTVAVSAVVNDGGLIDYTIGLTLTANDGRFLVTRLVGA